jgi:phytoene synthase
MQECRAITRQSASNLALAFVLLPKAKREGMLALYAFCREIDDIADDEGLPLAERRRLLAAWREDITRACQGGEPHLAVNREFQPIIARHGLALELFDELLNGVEMDLDTHRYQTFQDLDLYCYRVASVVGLLSIEIFGYKNPKCRDYADALGKALQLTNILRDVRADAVRGRVYIPLEELERGRVRPEEILQLRYSDRFYDVARAVAERAREYYRLAQQLLPNEDRRSMISAELMGSIYWRLLRKLERQRFDVFGPHRTRLSGAQKLLLILRTWYRGHSGAVVPNYG